MPDEASTAVRRCADPKCGAEFTPYKHGQKYHSPQCRKRHWFARRVERSGGGLACPNCGTKLDLALRGSS